MFLNYHNDSRLACANRHDELGIQSVPTRRARAMKTILTTTLAAAFMTTLGTAHAQSPNPPGIKLDHYQCYRLSPAKPFKQQKVKLTDQFGSSEAVVVREMFLCAPVEKNGGAINNKDDHLVCYIVNGGKDARKKVEITNQFGKAVLQLGGTVQLCVPSLKKVL
jgi:hypothetical protein